MTEADAAAPALPPVPGLPQSAPALARLLQQGLELVRRLVEESTLRAVDLRLLLPELARWRADAGAALQALPAVPTATVAVGGQVYWRCEDGTLVPNALVKDRVKLEDELVRAVAAAALGLGAELRRFRDQWLAEVAAYLGTVAQDYGAEGGGTGNVSLFSHDRAWRVTVARADRILFGPEIQTARELLIAWIAEQPAAADALKALITSALGLDREGYIRAAEVLRLRTYPIADPKWVAAMAAITDSIRTGGTAEYLRVHRRGPDGRYALVRLDLAGA